MRRWSTSCFILVIVFALILCAACSNDNDDPSTGSGQTDDDNDDATPDDDMVDDDATPDDDITDDDTVDDDTVDDDTVDDDTAPPLPDYDTEFEGYGADATGGAGGETATVTSLSDDGPGTLRQILNDATGPLIVEFDVDGVIELQHVLDIPSDVTIDARGRDVTISDNGFRIQEKENIILMNLAFVDISGETGDSIQIADDSRDIVIFHCRFDSTGLMPFIPDVPDEQISIIWGSGDITISWCRFSNHDKVLLFGNGDAPQSIDENIRVTLHHNLFENTGRRHPFMRYGKVDLYNNIIRNWQRYLDKTYGTRSQNQGEILAERNWYEQSNPLFLLGAYYQWGGKIKQVENIRTNDWIVLMENKPDEVFTRPYTANIHEPTQAWYDMMETHTGNTMPAP